MKLSRTEKIGTCFLVFFVLAMLGFGLFIFLRESSLLREAVRDATPTPKKIADGSVETAKEIAEDFVDFSLQKSKDVFSEIRQILKESSEDPSPKKEDKPTNQFESSKNKSLLRQGLDFGYSIAQTVDNRVQGFIEIPKNEQMKIGQDIFRKLTKNGADILQERRLNNLLRELAQPFLENISENSGKYEFHILNKPEVNAFTTVGRMVYVNRGLIDVMRDPAELQFVLGHEIAHSELGHCVKKINVLLAAEKVVGRNYAHLVNAAYQAVALGYSELEELAADRYSCQRMSLDRMGSISAIQRLQNLERSDRQDPDKSAQVISRSIEDHFASHPSGQIRIKNLRSVINEN